MAANSERGPEDDEHSPEDRPASPDNSENEYPIPSEQQQAITRAFSSITRVTSPVFNPIFERFTSDHVSRMIDNVENRDIREHEGDSSRRKYQFAYAVLVSLMIVGLIVFFTLSDNRDLIAPLVAAVAGFLGGFAAGQRFRP